MRVPIPIRGPLALPFRAFGITRSEHVTTCFCCRFLLSKQIACTPCRDLGYRMTTISCSVHTGLL
jgi:hypothetical protein